MTEELRDLEDKIDGLKIVLAMALNMLPEDEVRERLSLLEETARKQNMATETIAMIRDYREKWED